MHANASESASTEVIRLCELPVGASSQVEASLEFNRDTIEPPRQHPESLKRSGRQLS
jgi:hypothetical protein